MERKISIAPPVFQERAAVTKQQLVDAGVDLERDFPESIFADFLEYPVLSEGGWFRVIKHQPTLRTVSRVSWHLLGPVPNPGLSLD